MSPRAVDTITKAAEELQERCDWQEKRAGVWHRHYNREHVCRVELAKALCELDDPEQLAQMFHDAYERLAPEFGYETRTESRVAWGDVPEPNRRLMTAVAEEIVSRPARDALASVASVSATTSTSPSPNPRNP